MIPRILAVLTLLSVMPSPVLAQTPSAWTSFKVGTLVSFSNPFTVRPDGRFLYGEGGIVYSQDNFASPSKTRIANNTLTFDPSFIAVRSDTQALLGVGGSAPSSGLHRFDPSSPATAINTTALATLQNYNGVWWQHPTSGRSGWIIGGTNTLDSKHNLTFVSEDGTSMGAITTALSTYSGGLATDSEGNVCAGLSELFGSPDAAETEKVLKFTASQIDAAVAGVISSTPATLTKAEASVVFKAVSAASLAVDNLGRIWATGYLNDKLEVFDPVRVRSYAVTPVHPALAGAGASPVYQVATFQRAGTSHVAVLASDSFFTLNSDVAYTYAPAEDYPIQRDVYATQATVTLAEAVGTSSISFSIRPAAKQTITVPVTFTGTAKPNVHFTAPKTVTFAVGQTSAALPITIIDDGSDSGFDKTFTVTLGRATPAASALVSTTEKTVQVTITENDERPEVVASQSFGTLRVGSAFTHNLQMVGSAAQKFSATGLPKGLSIDRVSGKITGTPLVPGESSQVVITVTNAVGTSTSVAFVMEVEDFPATAKGQFIGLATRTAGSGQLGARIDFTVSKTATYTGSVTIGKKKYAIKGNLDTTPANPTFTTSITHGGVLRVLTVNIAELDGTLSGSFADGATLSGYQVLPTNLAEGVHHFAIAPGSGLDDPKGHGFGVLKTSNLGKVNISGRTADNTAFTGASAHGSLREVILYHALHKVLGSLSGRLVVDGSPDRAVTGHLKWFKPAQTTGLYAGGFSEITLAVSGGRYRPVSGSTLLLDSPTATLTLGTLLTSPVNFFSPAKLSIAAPTKLSINNATGAITGSFKSGSDTLPFFGLVIPTTGNASSFDGEGLGFFALPGNASSDVLEITP